MTGRVTPRGAAALIGPGGAAALGVAPLLGTGGSFDAALRATVWLAVVVAASSGAGKPAALFALVAAVVEISSLLTGPDGSAAVWPAGPAVVIATALVAARNGPSPGRVVRRSGRWLSAGRRAGPGAARIQPAAVVADPRPATNDERSGTGKAA